VCKLTVLVADDHEVMRRLLVSMLRLEFRVVNAVADGESLLEAALSLAPDVIVSDVSMPFMNGPEVMKALIARGHKIPFILVSIDSSGKDEFIRQGAAAFLDKTQADFQDDLLGAVHAAGGGSSEGTLLELVAYQGVGK